MSESEGDKVQVSNPTDNIVSVENGDGMKNGDKGPGPRPSGGHVNKGFEGPPPDYHGPPKDKPPPPTPPPEDEDALERPMWGNQLEFLMSCIATSVGLGNVWRFPFVAYQNGGGAFLIPYIIVLFLVGKPMYYLECVLGQFSSKNSVKVWALSPALKGVGYAQIMGCSYILSYYTVIIGLCLYYMMLSFSSVLPWAVCQEQWGDVCVPSSGEHGPPVENSVSSAELYFLNNVLQQSDGIEGGIGAPIWYLTLSLFVAWVIVFLVISRGVKSTGKASYFLALFPYVIMIILLIRGVTLEGSVNGILFLLTPQWDKLAEFSVWYAAVTQVFFSLSVSCGPVIMFSSYNQFTQNVYRDSMIVTTLDTFTGLLSGITTFAILGNLAHELGYENVVDVIGSGGTGLAFISYPDAIAKFYFVPQLFSVLFFLMMTVLGIGSAVALMSTVNTVLMDAFPRVPTIYMSAISCTLGFLSGLVYVTPGGQYILELVDYYGATFLVLFTAIIEIAGIFWVYGLENVCLDIEFMLNRKVSAFWRLCWGVVTPFIMVVVFIYALFSVDNLVFGEDYYYPTAGIAAGYIMLFSGIMLVPIFITVKMIKNKTGNFKETVNSSFAPKESWGPSRAKNRRDWIAFKQEAAELQQSRNASKFQHFWYTLTGAYRKNVPLSSL